MSTYAIAESSKWTAKRAQRGAYATGLDYATTRGISRADRDDRERRDGDRRGSRVLEHISEKGHLDIGNMRKVVLIITTKTSSMAQ